MSEALRPIRLWHFQQMTAARERAATCAATAECAKQLAVMQKHDAFVQTLDRFFMAGDTAAADATKARP